MPPKRKYGQPSRSNLNKRFKQAFMPYYYKSNYKQVRRSAARTNLKNQIHYFRRKTNLGSIVSTGLNTPTLTSFFFRLSDLPNVGEFTGLFDQFMITYVKLYFKLQQDPSAQTAANSFYPTLTYCPDYDDSDPPGSIQELREHGRTKQVILTPDKFTIVTVKPSVLGEMFRSSGNVTLAPKWRQWVDCAHPDTRHYGLKYALDNSFNINPNYSIEVTAEYWFSCKECR